MTYLKISEALQRGVEAHKRGNLQEAERYYLSILKAKPGHTDANHNMGVLLFSESQIEKSIIFFKRALEFNKSKKQYWTSLITAFLELDRLQEAENTVELAKKELKATHEIVELEKTISDNQKKISHNFEQTPVDRDQINHLFNLYSQKKYHEILKITHHLQKNYKTSDEVLTVRGACLRELKLFDDAIYCFRRSLSLNRDSSRSYFNLGLALMDKNNYEQAALQFEHASKLNPQEAQIFYYLGKCYYELGSLNKAIITFKTALKLDKLNINTSHSLANVLKDAGYSQEAEKYYEISIKNGDSGSSLFTLSRFKNYDKKEQLLKKAKSLLKSGKLSEYNKCLLFYTIGNINDDLANYSEAFRNFFLGGKIKKKLLNYELSQDLRGFQSIKKTWTRWSATTNRSSIDQSIVQPVFIVGMPRSGTSLIEQIISSHSHAHGAGELPHVPRNGFELNYGHKPQTHENIEIFRNLYLKEIEKIANGKKLVCDKLPANFKYLGLISKAFPEAKIVHTSRDPMATCWSNFKNYFHEDGLGYSYDINDTVRYFMEYHDLMNFWHDNLNIEIYKLDYEHLVENPVTEIKKLIKFLDLTWEEKCLMPHENARSVKTASQQQVRQEIYKGSSKSWLRYKEFLLDQLRLLNYDEDGVKIKP